MKKLLLLFSFLLIFNFVGYSQLSKQEIVSISKAKLYDKVNENYDKFKDQTTLRLMLLPIGEPIPYNGLTLNFHTSYDGKTITSDTRNVTLLCISQTPTAQYNYSHSLIILADGIRFNIGDGFYNKSSDKVPVIETMIYSIPIGSFQKIAASRKVEAQLGTTEFEFSTKYTALLKDYSIRLNPKP